MPFTVEGEVLILDWVLGGANPTRPTQRWVQFATQSPTSQSAFGGPIQSRMSVTFASANSPQMSVTNLNAFSATTCTAVATVIGWNLWDHSTGGTRLLYGTTTAAIGCKSADNIAIGAGQIIITLA